MNLNVKKKLQYVSRRTFSRRVNEKIINESYSLNSKKENENEMEFGIDPINISEFLQQTVTNVSESLQQTVTHSQDIATESFFDSDEYSDFYAVEDSDDDLECSDDEFDEYLFKKDLSEWAIDSNAPLIVITKLLTVLRKHGHTALPKTAQTLVGTPSKKCEIVDVCPGQYVHIGIEKNLLKLIKNHENPPSVISIDTHFDGVPITTSTNKQFWPILCRCIDLQKSPFAVGIYYGLKKPEDCSKYLEHYVQEMKSILRNGITFGGKTYQIKLNAFICDAPAQAFVKGIVGHNGYHGCGRCSQTGEWINNRLSFTDIQFEKRTDDSFKNRTDEFHHKHDSILEELDIGMVSQFPSDYLHLLCLGVTRKLLLFWTSGPLKTRLPFFKQQEISFGLNNCRSSQPLEFQRRCRGLDELKHWKGSEFRTFLFYTGPIVLKNVLSMDEYKNFLALHIAAKICNDPEFHDQLDVAQALLEYFVESFSRIYGHEYMSYNVHSLLHIVEDVRRFGRIENYSAFPFESFLGKMKKKIRNGNKMLEQIVHRIEEGWNTSNKELTTKYPILKKPSVNLNDTFVFIETENWVLKKDEKNCYFMDKYKNVIQFESVKKIDKTTYVLKGRKFLRKRSFYSSPLSSDLLDIFELDLNSVSDIIENFTLNQIKCKVFVIKHKNIMVSFPMCSN